MAVKLAIHKVSTLVTCDPSYQYTWSKNWSSVASSCSDRACSLCTTLKEG